MHIRQAMPSDFEAIAQFITPITLQPDTHSLHCDEDVASNLGSIQQKHAEGEEYFLMAFDKAEQLIGVFGGEMDVERNRIWAWGPFVTPSLDFREIADALYHRFLSDHQTTLQQVWAFNDQQSMTLRDFYNAHGFQENKGLIHVYRCSKIPAERFNDTAIQQGTEMHKDVVDQLHTTAFPGTYFTTQEMIDLGKGRFQLLVYQQAEKTLAYLFAELDGAGDGYIHFLAVDPEARGQGIGTKMLQQSLDWCFYEQQVPKVNLTVVDKNHARKMYEKAGFELLYSGVGTKKEITKDDETI